MDEHCESTVKGVETTPFREETVSIDRGMKQAHLEYFQNDLHKACSRTTSEELQNQPLSATAQRPESH